MLSLIAPGSTIKPVASERPSMVKTACTLPRSMLRKAMRNPGLNHFVRPMRSKSEGLKSAGGSGRMASAGGSLTACHTTLSTPRDAAPALTISAVASALVVQVERQRGEAEEQGVEIHQAAAHPASGDAADDGAEHDDDEGELQVVEADLPGGITKRLELGDLLALQAHEPREHRIHHEGGHAEEDERDRRRRGREARESHHPGAGPKDGPAACRRRRPRRARADGRVSAITGPAGAPGARSRQKLLKAPSRL